jgi:chromosome segregation ATPase
MNATQEQLQVLRTNLDRLVRSYQAVKGENEILKQQVDAQRRGLADKNKKIEELEKQFEVVKTAQTIVAASVGEDLPESKAEVKKRINELIKEVDNCIAMLND